MSKHWKSIERKVAGAFGSERTPLSGGNSKITRSDSLHDKLFIETKYRKEFAVLNLYKATKELAKKENKIPVVCLAENGKKGFYILVHSEDLVEVSECMKFNN
jgi:hypothetical protein